MPDESASPHDNKLAVHWQHFKRGLLLFIIGALLIMAGYRWQPLIQVPGLILLVLAVFYAAIGYAGILRIRLKKAFSIKKS